MTEFKFEDELLNFQEAVRRLSIAWDEDVETCSPVEEAIVIKSEFYPFAQSFEDLYPDVRTYVNAVIEEIDRQKMLRLFDYGRKEIQVMSIKQVDDCIEKYWFCKATLLDIDEVPKIEIFEEQTGVEVKILIEEFRESFLKVPESLYELSIIASQNNEQYSDVIRLAKGMGEKIK